MAQAPTRGYRHRQAGWTLIVGLGGVSGVGIVLGLVAGSTPLILLGALFGALTLSFGALTVTVDPEGVALRFGAWSHVADLVPPLRRRVPFSRIASYGPVRNHWLQGLGIRMLPNGWLWNVGGLDAVELRLEGGRVLRVGTDEPAALCAAIARAAPGLRRFGPDEPAPRPTRGWWLVPVAVVLVVGAAVVATFVLEARPPRVTLDSQALVVDGAFFDARIPRTSIVDVELLETLPRIRVRTWGYADGRRMRGWFRVDGLGEGQVFVDVASPPFILARTREGFLIVNADDPDATRRLAQALSR